MPKHQLRQAYGAVDCVLDQFVIPCMGGIPTEVIAVNHCPVVTCLDDAVQVAFFGETIPLLNCRTAEEIAEVLEWVLLDDPRCGQRVRECYAWMMRHHSHHTVLETIAHAVDAAYEHVAAARDRASAKRPARHCLGSPWPPQKGRDRGQTAFFDDKRK